MRIIAPLLSALMLVGPLRLITVPSPVEQAVAQGVEICGLMPLEGRVVQNCDLRNAGFRELEQQAINDLLAAHQLPASDAQALIAWEPDAVRAAMFASMMTMMPTNTSALLMIPITVSENISCRTATSFWIRVITVPTPRLSI